MKAWIILPCLNGSGCWWCNGVGVFSWHTSINWACLNPQSTWVLLLTIIPLWLQCTIFWCTSSRIMLVSQSSNHLRLVSWTWQWVHFTQITSTVTRSQSNRAFGMWWNERFSSWMCRRQICSNCVMLSWQYGPKSIKTLLKAKGGPTRCSVDLCYPVRFATSHQNS